MNFFEAIENAQEKISKLGNDLNDVCFEIRRISWGAYATLDDFQDIIILIDKDGIQRMSKHDSKNCGLTLEDLKAQDWEVVK
jgi:hypothetical protein